MRRTPTGPARAGGFTLIEMLVVVVVTIIVIAVAAPSLKSVVLRQRVRAVNQQLVTDLQFARSEAVARNMVVRTSFRRNTTFSCYAIFSVTSSGTTSCNCTLTTPCTSAGANLLRQTRVEASDGVMVAALARENLGQTTELEFDPVDGSLRTKESDFSIESMSSFSAGTFRAGVDPRSVAPELKTVVGQSGRPTVCAPSGSMINDTSC